MAYDYDLICIGSGPAGQRAAVQAAKLGKKVAVVEKRDSLGGVCVNTGTIPSKTFREAVLFFTSMSGRFDTRQIVRGGTRPKAEELLAKVGETVAGEQAVVERQLRRNDVTVIRGEAYFVDPHTIGVRVPNAEGKMTTEFAFIGAGTHPAKPRGIEADGETVMTSDDVVSMKTVPRSLAVVGAGVIGIEYASMFSQLGTEVTMIEKRERPLDFLDREIVDELMHQMRDSNVTFRLEESVASIRVEEKGAGKRAVIELESGKRIISDAALFSAGRVASTDQLHLDAAGVPIGDRGRLAVDEHFRTAVPHVYAGGDVIGAPALAATSAEQGRRAACHMFGASAEPMPPWYPFGIYAIPEISMVGETEEQLTDKKVPYEIGLARYREIARGQILGDNSGLFKMIFHRDTRKLLGVHIIGTHATELVHIGQAVLALGGGLDYFIDAVFNYPTLAECYKVAALDAANKLSA
jgi:NAD(P) transhydrogenase